MTRIDDLTRLRHMRDSAIEAMSFVENHTRKNLNSDRIRTLALVKAADCKAKYPQVPWVQMIGMRNRLTHAYFEIDLAIVWQVVTNDLPLLVTELEQIIALET